jgi:two-component system response regulator YesN
MSYEILLVDDEIHAVEGVRADLDMDKLNISALYTAYNIRQAKEIFDANHIDILLCDIEMPQGSGLELLSWVREHHPRTAAIFLTSHSDFHYAKEAMRLGSLDYLLKPLMKSELEEAIRKAQNVINHQSEVSKLNRSHQLWMKHQTLVIERFWLDLINQTIPSHLQAIREQIERANLPILEEALFVPVLISVKNWNKSLSRRDEKIMEYALKKTAEEIMIATNNGIVFQLEPAKLMVIYTGDVREAWYSDEIERACARYIEFCRQYFYCDLTCYKGAAVRVQEMAGLVAELKERDRHNVAFFNQVYICRNEAGQMESCPVEIPDTNIWMTLLKTGKTEIVVHQVRELLDGLVESKAIDLNRLYQFREDFAQALYTFLNLRGIQAHQLYGDEVSRLLSEKAVRSVNDMMSWVQHAVSKALHQVEAVQEAGEVVDLIKAFIANHIDQDLSREVIAGQVYLNPDHLSRLFKKETGYSISEYVLKERITLAQELLTRTSMSISEVALSVGYSNFSHFTKIFKKYAGLGPMEYRLKHAEEGKPGE